MEVKKVIVIVKFKCIHCSIYKPIANFSKNKKGEYFKSCDDCRDYHKNYREAHADEIKQYYKDHVDELKICHKKYKKAHVYEQKIYNQKYHRGDDIRSILVAKIACSLQTDRVKNRPYTDDNKITIDYVLELYNKLPDYKCPYCSIEMVCTNFEKHQIDQITINRLDNCLAHIKGNVEFCCYFCNIQRGKLRT